MRFGLSIPAIALLASVAAQPVHADQLKNKETQLGLKGQLYPGSRTVLAPKITYPASLQADIPNVDTPRAPEFKSLDVEDSVPLFDSKFPDQADQKLALSGGTKPAISFEYSDRTRLNMAVNMWSVQVGVTQKVAPPGTFRKKKSLW